MLKRTLSGRPDKSNFLRPEEIRPERASALHESFQFILDAAKFDSNAFGKPRIQGKLEVINVVSRVERLVTLLCHSWPTVCRVSFPETPRVIQL